MHCILGNPPCGARGRRLIVWSALLMLVCTLPARAQQEAPAPAAAPGPIGITLGDVDLRIQFPLISQMSYTVHPFFQITGDAGFRDGKAASALITSIGTRTTDENANFLEKLVHSLPPFGVEGVMGIDLPVPPRGLSFGFDHAPFFQRDVDAAEGVSTVIPIEMDLFYYSGALRFFIFDPNEPGINFFVGFGLGWIDGAIKAEPFAGQAPEIIPLSAAAVGSFRWGLEARGDNWGFRYELMVLSADDVDLASNPYPNGGGTEIDFSGALIRLSLFVQF